MRGLRSSHRVFARGLGIALMALLCCLVISAVRVSAKDCATRDASAMLAWKHEQGSFQCVNCLGAGSGAVKAGAMRRQWKEFDRDRRLLNTFTEEMRDGTQLVLRDEERDMAILLRSDLCGVRTGAEQNFRQLYGGTFMTIVDCT